jgi:hypothetical protein
MPLPVKGRAPSVAFIDPRVPLVEVFGSGLAVTGPGVVQDTAITMHAIAIYKIFILSF